MAKRRREGSSVPTPITPPRRVTLEGLTELLDLSPDALIIIDHTGTIVQANEHAATLFGYPLQALLEQPLETLLPDRFRSPHAAHRTQYFTAPQMRAMGTGLDLLGRRKDGTEFAVDISLRPVQLDDEILAIGAIRNVSEQRRAEHERLRQAEYLRMQAELINLTHDAILVRDPASRVIFWNKGAEELYGWTQEEAYGRVTHSLLHTRFPVSLAETEAQLNQKGRWEGELVHTCRDGSRVIVESRQAQVHNSHGHSTAILEINRNITQRRQFEQATQATHAETIADLAFRQQILDALPSSVYLVYGPDARLLLANRAALSVWGAEWRTDQPMAEFLTTNKINIFTAQGQPLAVDEFATVRAVREGTTVLHKQETIRRQDGSLLPVLVNVVVLDTTIRPSMLRPETEATTRQSPQHMALVVHQDVSALKEAEYLKDEFIGMAAHELRNPLGALKGFADMLVYQTMRGKGSPLADWQNEALEEIAQATVRLDKLTEDLLDVTRLQAGRLVLSRKPIDLVSLTRRMIAQAQMTTKRHTFSFASSLTSLMVEADRGRIEQVLSNLFSNAVKYSPQGGSIEVTLYEKNAPHVALLSIRDHGIGIPTDQQARIFGRFVRAENARETEITGTGLGLYLSRELVEQHAGHIWFESVEDTGTTFFLSIPVS